MNLYVVDKSCGESMDNKSLEHTKRSLQALSAGWPPMPSSLVFP